jgi:hypothetical protein
MSANKGDNFVEGSRYLAWDLVSPQGYWDEIQWATLHDRSAIKSMLG